MNNTIKIYIAFLLLLFVAIIYIDANRPRPIDWTPTYDLKDKIPFGLYIFDNEVKSLLQNDSIEKISKTLYEYKNNGIYYDDYYENDSILSPETYLHISNYYDIDEQSTKTLLTQVKKGNNAFIIASDFSQMLQDSLKFIINYRNDFEKYLTFSLANKTLAKDYQFNIGASTSYFNKIDTTKTTVLGYQKISDSLDVNFVKIPFGKGSFYLHTQPCSFTNYHLLKENHHQYLEKITTYIPKTKLIWLVKGQDGEMISYSPMRFILSKPALKWAWYLFLIGMLVFMFFNAKRKQRVVPIIKPLENTTVDFTKTIGNLYYQEGNHQNIIDKKIIYFLEKIRNEYLLDTKILDDNFIKKLQLKSGKKMEDIQEVVKLINYQRKNTFQSIESDLIALNNAIEKII